MSTYTPDRWVVVRIVTKSGNVVDKVLAGWYGGYLSSDHWQLNSGIERSEEFADRFEFHGYSGSLYICYKAGYGFSNLTRSVLSSWQNKGIDMTVLEEYDVRSDY